MATIDNAVRYLEQNEMPYWSIHAGNSKVGQSNGTDNLQDSITRFRECMELLAPGSYKLVCAKNPNDNRGGLTFSFSKGQTNTQAVPTTMNAVSTNEYGIPDHILKKVQEETRFKLLVEGMADDFKLFMKEWPEYKKKIDRIEDYLKDEDGDGTPDFMQMAKNASDTVNSVREVKKVIEGGSAFRL